MLKNDRIQTNLFGILVSLNLLFFVFLITELVEGIFVIWAILLLTLVTPFLIKNKRNVIAIIVFLIPLEISKAYIPILKVVESASGDYNSIFDLARLFMLYSFIVWFITDLRSFVPFIKHKLSYVLGIFILYYLISAIFISPAFSKGLNETIRYVIYFLFLSMVVQYIREHDDYFHIIKSMIIVTVLLSLFGIAEYFLDFHLWKDIGRRAAATFIDPNIFARFLNIVICAIFILRIKKIHVIKPLLMDLSLILAGIALLLTVSRQGWFVLFITILIISFFFEKKVRNRILLGLIAIAIVATPILLLLLRSRQAGLEMYDIGTRAGLILGGLLMFAGSPIFGVGAAGFQTVIIDKYLDYLPWGIQSATLSHTYVVTVLSELGTIGIILLIGIIIFTYKGFRKSYRSHQPKTKALSIVTFAALLIIFISSQAEGRFVSDPMLWLFLGLNMALERMDYKPNELLP